MEHDGILTINLCVYVNKQDEDAKWKSVVVARIPCTRAGSLDAFKNFAANNEWAKFTNASWQSTPEWVA
jgi:hypothetical protein